MLLLAIWYAQITSLSHIYSCIAFIVSNSLGQGRFIALLSARKSRLSTLVHKLPRRLVWQRCRSIHTNPATSRAYEHFEFYKVTVCWNPAEVFTREKLEDGSKGRGRRSGRSWTRRGGDNIFSHLSRLRQNALIAARNLLFTEVLTRLRALQDYPSVHNNDSVSHKALSLHSITLRGNEWRQSFRPAACLCTQLMDELLPNDEMSCLDLPMVTQF